MKKRYSAALSIIVIAVLACNAMPGFTAVPTATMTPMPTFTSTSTETLMPTETILPTETLTPTEAMPTKTLMAKTPALTQAGAEGVNALKIVSSLPMTGSSEILTKPMVNAMQLRVNQTGGVVCGGKYTLSYEAWDDASRALGKWDPDVETRNANKAAADSQIVAYLGTFNSGAAKISIPILNKAGPLVMISPGNTYPGLTHAVEGMTMDGEPDKFYPIGVRNYARVSPSDDFQAPIIANFMAEKGVKTLYILDDGESYGKGMADLVHQAAEEAGIVVIKQQTFDPSVASYMSLMVAISASDKGRAPDAIFLGTFLDNNAAQVLKDKVAVMGDNDTVKFFGPDGLYTNMLIEEAGEDVAEGVFAITSMMDLKDLGAAGKKFYAEYKEAYGATKEPYAILGYEAMNVAIKAIEDVCAAGGDPTDRAAITAAVFAIKDFDGALGTWSFDENGDITPQYSMIAQVQDGQFVSLGTYNP